MKVWMEPIEMIASFDANGTPRPLKYRWQTSIDSVELEPLVVKVGRVIECRKEKLAGNQMMIYRCQSIIGNVEKVYELKYELSTCKWYLYKL